MTAGEFSKFYLLDVTQGMVVIESNQVTSLKKRAIEFYGKENCLRFDAFTITSSFN